MKKESDKKRDEVLKRMLATPPKPKASKSLSAKKPQKRSKKSV